MPTAPRAVAAIFLAALAWIVSKMIIGLMPERTVFGAFIAVNMGLAAVTGWVVIGKRAGRGWSAAIGNGLTGMAAAVIWVMLAHSFYGMIQFALRRHYDGPMEAFTAIFANAAHNATYLGVPTIALTLIVGGVLAGLVAEQTSRHWK